MANYISIDDAQTYFDGRLHTTDWDNAEDDDKTKALTMATRAIDNLNFQGEKTVSGQINQFPRDGDLVVPQEIKDATCELALTLLGDYESLDEAVSSQRVLMERYSTIQTTYANNMPQENIINGIPSMAAWQLLKPFLRDPRDVNVYRG